MKVAEFIRELEKLDYNEDTEICFGLCDYNGEWYKFEIREIENNININSMNIVAVDFEPNEEYDRSVSQEANIELEEDLKYLIWKYC